MQKQQIPHQVKFPSGQSILVTMYGRPPYCLKCSSIGHVRQRCPGKLFSAAASANNNTSSSKAAGPSPAAANEGSSGVSPGPSDPSDTPKPQVGDDGASDAQQPGSDQQSMEQNSDQSLKRPLDSQDSDFIPPNRPARRRQLSECHLDLSNKFSPIMSVSDIMSLVPK